MQGDDLVFNTYSYYPNGSTEFSSFVSAMVTNNTEKLVQLQRYDLKSKEKHKNYQKDNINTKLATDDTKEIYLYKKYFKATAPIPHFHFGNNKKGDKLAINLGNLIEYIKDLINADKQNDICKYNLGMPFLEMRTNEKLQIKDKDVKKFLDNIKECYNNIASNKTEKLLTEILKDEIDKLNVVDLTANSLEFSYWKLKILDILHNFDGTGVKEISNEFIEHSTILQLEIANNIASLGDLVLDLKNNKYYEEDKEM